MNYPGPAPLSRAAHRQRIDAQRGLANADGHRLAFFAAGPDPAVEFHVVAHHAHPSQHVRAVADQVAPFTGAVILPFSIKYASLAENTNLPR